MGRYKLMLVDDEQWALVGLEEILDWEAEGFTIVARCSCGKEALQKAKQFRPDAIITDIRMPDMTGLQLIEELRVSMPDIPCMVVSAYSDFDMAREAIRLDAVYYALKPFSKEEMGEAVSMMREKLRRNGKSEKEELVPLVIEEEAPVFPLFEGKGRKCYLLLAEELGSLPEQERQEDCGSWCRSGDVLEC